MTDNPKPKRKPEKRETANSRRERFTAEKPEVRGIYKEKEHHAAIKDFAKTLKSIEIRKLKAEINKAKRALESAGYSLLEGAQEWKPPIGPSPSPLLDLIDSLRAELEAARKQDPVGFRLVKMSDIVKIHECLPPEPETMPGFEFSYPQDSANAALRRVREAVVSMSSSPAPAQQVETTGEIPDFTEEETQRLIERLTSLKGEVVKVPIQNDLAVWYGPMPESNGKTNWTAILYRKNPDCRMGGIGDGYTIDRSEYPDRVRYEADRVRHLIGELKEPPFILDYDENKHSGYEEQQPSAVTHWSDCATNNGPAMEPGECDCGGYPPRDDKNV